MGVGGCGIETFAIVKTFAAPRRELKARRGRGRRIFGCRRRGRRRRRRSRSGTNCSPALSLMRRENQRLILLNIAPTSAVWPSDGFSILRPGALPQPAQPACAHGQSRGLSAPFNSAHLFHLRNAAQCLLLFALFLVASASPAFSQFDPPLHHYDAAIGKTGAALDAALHIWKGCARAGNSG